MITFSYQIIIYLRCQSVGEYELAGIKKNTVWMRSRHRAQDWAEIFGRSCMILWTGIRMITLDPEYEYPSRWKCERWLVWEGLWTGWRLGKGRAIFLKGSRGQEELLVGEDRVDCAAWEAEDMETALAAPSSSGCALPAAFWNALWQRLHLLSGFSTCSGNVCSLNSQIHFIRNLAHRRKWVLSVFS